MSAELVFAIGDIHGRLDLAQAAVTAISDYTGARPSRTIFLGDYIDRGPHSRQVVELMMELTRSPNVICLKGNHEAMMLKALEDGGSEDFARWMATGGGATIESYGAACDCDSARNAVAPEHLRWMTSLPTTSGDGHRIYVHAGLLPSTPLHAQTEEVFLWVRERFLRAKASEFDSHIVHGHTPVWAGKPVADAPELLAHRTNLDIGAYFTDGLAIGVFDAGEGGGPLEVIVVRGRAGEPISTTRLQSPTASPMDGPPATAATGATGRLAWLRWLRRDWKAKP
jgi:serine/threonine protein phosphatase 1